MFPNFTSLAQREQKRQELLERAQRRVQQAKTKRFMYVDASWASDVDKTIATISKKSTDSTQTDISVGPNEETPEILKLSLAEILKKDSMLKTPKQTRGFTLGGVAVADCQTYTNDRGLQTRSDTTDRGLQAPPITDLRLP